MKNKIPAGQLLAMSLMMNHPELLTEVIKPEPPKERPCLQCGKTKQHNNAYCSAKCCKKHKCK